MIILINKKITIIFLRFLLFLFAVGLAENLEENQKMKSSSEVEKQLNEVIFLRQFIKQG